MSSQKKPQIVVLLAALFLIVLLVLAPRINQEARKTVETLAEEQTDPLKQRIDQAVAMVQSGGQPMQGIMMLREVLNEDPNNVEAHWHLAHFSIQSEQFDKAAERFEKVVELDTELQYPDAIFYLGKTYATLNRNDEAVVCFEKYMPLTQDTIIKKRVQEFIVELKNKQQ
jgi:tetratricopeptide (TPR) repeat protein